MSLVLDGWKLRFNVAKTDNDALTICITCSTDCEIQKWSILKQFPIFHHQRRNIPNLFLFTSCGVDRAVRWNGGGRAQKTKEEKEIFTLPESQWNDFRKQTPDCDERGIVMKEGRVLGRGNINLSCWTDYNNQL